MADIISASFDCTVLDRDRNAAPADAGLRYDLIELLFFAYRDFVGEADSVLAEYGFWRAHHRVLHFVDRNPGIRVAELLAILKITKQSLGRVLKELVDKGFIEQRQGASDRRQRLLHTTAEGHALAYRLSELQNARIAAALAKLDPEASAAARTFLIELVNADERPDVERLIREKERAS
ncbi:MarR family winged helix-turn-helix transcriptional regulator [Amorphus orientalis]|uniref:DNA-binding MarR family transcriptional regulator n=1 Tax=Amorphus orientalis TaxID=649198 RepID=A0AAE3VLG2_9HYPH|nr:MarR family transcriptional regulator [Amorphus orientalis]MDQ0314236.1 DNA-binding MarR family transcriptional regulator [Amorphus orientalis]